VAFYDYYNKQLQLYHPHPIASTLPMQGCYGKGIRVFLPQTAGED